MKIKNLNFTPGELKFLSEVFDFNDIKEMELHPMVATDNGFRGDLTHTIYIANHDYQAYISANDKRHVIDASKTVKGYKYIDFDDTD